MATPLSFISFATPNLTALQWTVRGILTDQSKTLTRSQGFTLVLEVGLGHLWRPREFAIDDQSSSERRSQTATGSLRLLSRGS